MPPISTRNLDALPDIDGVKALLQSLATLDVIMCDDWESRYYSFNCKWAEGEQMGSMRNGSGDGFFAFFNQAGCFIKGFAHESPMSSYRTQPPQPWPGVLDGVPDDFSSALGEPAFSMDEVSFCIWRRNTDSSWSHGSIDFPKSDDPDGSAVLLACLDGNPAGYRQYAEEYYEATIPLDAVRHVYEHLPLTTDVIESLNADQTMDDIAEEIDEIGYPSTS